MAVELPILIDSFLSRLPELERQLALRWGLTGAAAERALAEHRQEMVELGAIAWPKGDPRVVQLRATATMPTEPTGEVESAGPVDLLTATRTWMPIERIDAAGEPYVMVFTDELPPLPTGAPVLDGHGGPPVGRVEHSLWVGGGLTTAIRWSMDGRLSPIWPIRAQLQAGQLGCSIGAVTTKAHELAGRWVLVVGWDPKEVSLVADPGCTGAGWLCQGH